MIAACFLKCRDEPARDHILKETEAKSNDGWRRFAGAQAIDKTKNLGFRGVWLSTT